MCISLAHEGKGIDAGPGCVHKLKSRGFKKLSDIVSIIVEDEKSHVSFGVKWYKY